MSPEQTRGEQLDHRSDIFSLGICMYELLSGRLPFFDPDADEVLRRVQEEQPRPIKEQRPETPRILEDAIFHCIEKDPEARFQGMDELIELLDRVDEQLMERGEDHTFPSAARDHMEILTLDMVDREKEYQKLSQAYFRSISGRGTTVFIQGEAGIGKTRLIEELTKHCDVAQVNVATGQAHPGLTLPYRPVSEAIRYLMLAYDVVTDKEVARFIDTHYGRATLQSRILKSFLINQPSRHLETAGRENIFDAVSDLLARFAQRAPLVLVLENMHWADRTTLDLLLHLTGTIQGRKILMLVSFRPHEPGLPEEFPLSDIIALVEEKKKSGDALLLRLDRFAEKDTRNLVNFYFPGNKFEDTFYHRIFGESDGNPLFILELLKLFMRQGIIIQDNKGWVQDKGEEAFPVPTRINDLISRRLSGLDEREIRILEAAAVEGVSFTSESVGYLTRIDRLAVLNLLRDLFKEQLIHLKGESYRFNPSLVREVIYRQMMPELKREYHKLLAEFYLKSPPPGTGSPAEVARHFHLSGNLEQAVNYYMEAGNAALNLHADREALTYFNSALELLDELPLGPGMRTALNIHLLRAEIYTRTGDMERAREEANEALGLAKAISLAEEIGRSFKLKGKIAHLCGDGESAESHLEKALTYVIPPSDRAETLNLLGLISENSGDHGKAMRLFQDSLNISNRDRNRLRMAQTLNHIGRTLLNKGDPRAALVRFRNALDITKEIGDRRGIAVNTNNVGILLRRMDRLRDALRLFFGAARIFKEIRYPDGAANSLWNIGNVFRALGDRKKAEKFMTKAHLIFERIGSQYGVTLCALSLGNTLAAAGETDQALERLSVSLDTGRKTGYRRIVAYGLQSRGALELSLGLIDAAIRSLEEAQEEAKECEDLILSANILSQLGLARSIAGSNPKGLNLLEAAVEAAVQSRDPTMQGEAYFLHSRNHLMGGGLSQAVKSFYKGSTFIGRNARPARKAELYFTSGLVELNRNRPQQASRKFESALALYQQLNYPLKMLDCLHGLAAAYGRSESMDRRARVEALRLELIKDLMENISSPEVQAVFQDYHLQGGGLAFIFADGR
jgi:predicted ATPase